MLNKLKNFIKKISINKDELEWGYSTCKQKRYKRGTKLKISEHKIDKTDEKFPIGCDVWIIERGRHDYLVKNNNGDFLIVYQYELRK